jgi:maltose O-acetyltransferase
MKTHKEKMLAGELYSGGDPELVEGQHRAQEFMESYAQSSPRQPAIRRAMLEKFLGAIGPETVIRPRFSCDYGYNIFLGARCFVNFDCVFLDCNTIRIGDDVQIAPGVHIYTATHPIDPEERKSGLESALPVVIEQGVWLGGGAIICPGVTIGANSVIGAGSVVTKSIPANVVAAGNPCRVIRSIS